MADSKLTALTPTTTPAAADELYIVTDTGGTPTSQKIAYSDLVESKVIDTARQYTKGQGMTNTALTISTGTTAIDFTDGNSFTLTLTSDTELQLPTNDRPFSAQVWVTQSSGGGWSLTFDAGYVVLGDTLTTVDGDKALLNIASNGSGDLVIIINNLQ